MKKLTLLCAALLLLCGCTPKAVESPSPSPTRTPAVTAKPAPPVATPSAPPEGSPEPEETPAPSPMPQGWDGTLETLALADFPTELMDRPIAAEDTAYLYLVAQLPEEETRLYSYHSPAKEQGLILRIVDNWQHFNLAYAADRAAPSLDYGDFDGDLDLELALRLYVGGGTGVSVWELHIIELGGGVWTDRKFSPEDYQGILDGTVVSAYTPGADTITLSAGDSVLELPLPIPVEELGDFRGVGFGETVSYTVAGDGVRVRFDGWLDASGVSPANAYFVTANADVIYTGSIFGLANLTLAPME